eukprot:627409-Hanusia_phi.AAC.1
MDQKSPCDNISHQDDHTCSIGCRLSDAEFSFAHLIHYVCSTQLVKFIALLPAESSAHGEGNGSAGVL